MTQEIVAWCCAVFAPNNFLRAALDFFQWNVWFWPNGVSWKLFWYGRNRSDPPAAAPAGEDFPTGAFFYLVNPHGKNDQNPSWKNKTTIASKKIASSDNGYFFVCSG